MIHIAIFASGSGSNAEQLAKHFHQHANIQVACLVSNRKNAGVFNRLANFDITPYYVAKEDWENESMILDLLAKHQIDYIVLAGFLLKIPAYLIAKFPTNIINVHPSLLPKYGGKGMYGMHVHEAVKLGGESETGITIHLVNEEFDQGKIIFQASCPVDTNDTPETIATKVQAMEHQHLAKAVISEILKQHA